MNDLTILELCSIIIAIGGAGAVLARWLSPGFKLAKRVDKLEIAVSAMTDIKEMNSMLCRGMMSLIEHELTGNGIDKLKTVKNEIQDYLIDRSQ